MKTYKICCLLLLGAVSFPAVCQLAAPTAQSATPSSTQPAAPQQSVARAGKKTGDVPAPKTTGATIKVKVNLVEVRAVVLDAHRHAVGNLKHEDFQLFDNGEPQVISKFSVEKAETTPAIHPQPSQEVEGEKPAGQAAVVMPQRYIAYLFDDIHLQFNDLAQVRAAAERNLQTLQPTDRAGIFTTSGQNQLDFTDNQAKLREAMNRILPRPMNVGCVHCTNYEGQVSLASLENVVRGLAGRPGERNIILVSPGFVVNPDQMQGQMEIADQAVHFGVVINALDPRGLSTGMLASYSPAPNVGPAASSRLSTGGILLPSNDADVLVELAYTTGGTFIQNSNDFEGGLRKLAAPPEYTYLLGFSPQNLENDGKFHHLQLKVNGPGRLTVQARKGYYAPRQAVDATEQAKQEIRDEIFSHEEVRDIPMQMRAQFVKTGRDAAKLSVLVRLDVRHLHYRKADGRNQDSLTVVSALFDHNGKYVNDHQQVVNMDVTDETLERKLDSGVMLKSEFDVKPGSYLVRLVARDDEGQLAAENGEIEIP